MKNTIDKKKLREFGFLISLLLPIFMGWFIPYLRGHVFNYWTLLIAIPSFILAILNPKLLLRPYKLWMKIGYILGWINNFVQPFFIFNFVV